MSQPRAPRLTVDDARHAVERLSFASTGSGRVGLECEFFVYRIADPSASVDDVVLRLLGDMAFPGGAVVTMEPGGQLELSGPPAPDVGRACTAMATDVDLAEAVLAEHGFVLAGVGLDPLRSPRRVLHAPRYDAMEAFFDGDGPAGRRMMCSTASVQVNLDVGPVHQLAERWALAHAVSPVLAAAFANSAMMAGHPVGRRSARLATWWAIDPSRTAPAGATEGIAGWVDYAMRARVMLIRCAPDRFVPMTRPITLGEWVEHGHPLGDATEDDVAYHLTTLFPPVRPRQRIELRVMDALPSPWWRVAAAVATALLDDPAAAGVVRAAGSSVAGLWREAGEQALSHPRLATAAAECFDAALDALPRVGADPETVRAAHRFAEQYVFRGRAPADDQLDTWSAAWT